MSILIELLVLEVALLLVLAYSAWRHDPQDRPLALLRGFVMTGDLGISGLTALWRAYRHLKKPFTSVVDWAINVLFVSAFVGLWVTASRYHHGRWPARLWAKAGALVAGFLLVSVGHYIQRTYMGLGPWDVGIKWVSINLSCLFSAVMAGWHLTQVLRKQEVALAHLVLGFSIVISLVQFILALRPWAWDMKLAHLASLVFVVVSLTAYGVRLARHAFARQHR